MYTDLLTRLKNAQAVKKESVKLPYSKMDEAVLGVLLRHGYVEDVQKRGRMPKRILDVKLKYSEMEGVIRGVRFISKPSRRLYIPAKKIRPARHGYGLLVVTTPQGVMSGGEARRKNIGGEMLFEIW